MISFPSKFLNFFNAFIIFNKNVLSTCYVSDTVLSNTETKINKKLNLSSTIFGY